MEARKEFQLHSLEDLAGDPSLTRISSLPKPGHGKDQNEARSGAIHVHRAKSLSAQFLVNIDGLMEKGCVLSRASSKEIGIFSLPAPSLPQGGISVHGDNKVGVTSPDGEDNQDCCFWSKIQIEPTIPIHLDFENVKYKITVKGDKLPDAEKCIIHGVTGSVRPGEVLALMGPSGGGKTTLLNVLSGRVKINGGTITYNDQPYSKSLKRRIGYVLQDDIVFSHLTVKETLTYAALLRLPKTLTREQKKERALTVICELDLERCQDTVIGGAAFMRGISGGERKRLCIGHEILLNPSLLFLDEPTSGLDSTTALRIVQLLHNIAEGGKTVVTTIHQPSSRLFSKFDKLILLGKGSCLYFGKASEAMVYFSSIGCSPVIAMNPAEFLIDLANGNMKDKSVPSELEVKILPRCQRLEATCGCLSPIDVHEYLVEAYEAKVTNMDQTNFLRPIRGKVELEIHGWNSTREWGTTWWEQFSILFIRGLKERRHEHLSSLRIIQAISTAIVVGLLWFHSDASNPKGLQDQAGLLFFLSVFWAFFPIFTAIFTFPQERAMLLKERSVDMYRLSAFLMARNSSDLPLDLLLPTVFMLMVYFMVGLKLRFSSFMLTLLTIFLSIIASQGLGLSLGAAFMDAKKANTLASITVMTFMLSGGFFIQKLPPFMSWIRYISVNYHTYRLLLKIQYGCSGSGYESGSGPCESPFITRQRLGWGGTEVGAMLAMVIGYRLLAYLFLRRMKLRKTT